MTPTSADLEPRVAALERRQLRTDEDLKVLMDTILQTREDVKVLRLEIGWVRRGVEVLLAHEGLSVDPRDPAD